VASLEKVYLYPNPIRHKWISPQYKAWEQQGSKVVWLGNQ